VLDFSLEECRIVTSFGFVVPGEAISLTIGAIRLFGDVSLQESREVTVKFRTRLHPAIIAHIGFGSHQPRAFDTLAERVRRAAPTCSRASILKGPQEAAAFFDMPAEGPSAEQ
jgi:hypothetical protein